MSKDYNLTDVVNAFLDDFKDKLNTSFVGVVVSYNEITQEADIKPVVRKKRRNVQLGEESTVSIPTLLCVPIAWPGGDGSSIVSGLAKGDSVVCIVADRSIEDWQISGLADIFPLSDRRFDLSDVFAFPCIRPTVAPLLPTAYKKGSLVLAAAEILAGSSLATDPVALANLCMTWFGQIDVQLKLLLQIGLVPIPLTSAPPGTATVASTKLKAE